MFGAIKKTNIGRSQTPSPIHDPRPQRRPPSTPPLPLRTLQLVAKKPESAVVLRDRKKVKGHVSSVRDSWPGAGQVQKFRTGNSRCHMTSTAPPTMMSQSTLLPPQPHWSVPCRASQSGRGSEASMMSLLLFCHSSSSNSLMAIDNKIEQAMDLVKSHLMLAVREEVELLREQIRELQEKNQHLERENHILRTLTHNIHNT